MGEVVEEESEEEGCEVYEVKVTGEGVAPQVLTPEKTQRVGPDVRPVRDWVDGASTVGVVDEYRV